MRALTAEHPVPAGPRRRLRIKPATWQGALSLLAAAGLWELAGRTFLNNPLFFAPLSTVLARMGTLWATGDLQRDTIASLQEFVLGFTAASVVGILVGVVMASSKPVANFLDPWVSMMYATPFVALAPLLVLWLGIGLAAHAAVIFLVVVFPVLINTYVGLSNCDDALVEVAVSYGASPVQVFTKIRFPSALPFVVAGLRQGIARGLVGVVVAELFGSKAGLGYLILVSGQTFDAAGLLAGIFIFAVTGVVAVELVKLLERRMAPWRFQETGE